MDLAVAKELLDACVREELQDHAFGDVEVFWSKDYIQIAEGHFSGRGANIWFRGDNRSPMPEFSGELARQLRKCGTEGAVCRNDETGPDEFVEGQVMPGLTKEAVRRNIFDSRYHGPACGCDQCLGKDRID